MTIRSRCEQSPTLFQVSNLEESAAEEQTPEVSSAILEAMANPFRQRAYDTLLIFGDMTARKLARLTNLSEASLNRHMQRLQEIGFVRPVNPEAPIRQLVWHAIRGGVRIGELSGSEEHAEAADAWFRAQIESQAHVLQEWTEVSGTWPVEWQTAVERWDYVLKAITAEELDTISSEFYELVARWRAVSEQHETDGTPDTRAVYLVTHALPWPVRFDAFKGEGE